MDVESGLKEPETSAICDREMKTCHIFCLTNHSRVIYPRFRQKHYFW